MPESEQPISHEIIEARKKLLDEIGYAFKTPEQSDWAQVLGVAEEDPRAAGAIRLYDMLTTNMVLQDVHELIVGLQQARYFSLNDSQAVQAAKLILVNGLENDNFYDAIVRVNNSLASNISRLKAYLSR